MRDLWLTQVVLSVYISSYQNSHFLKQKCVDLNTPRHGRTIDYWPGCDLKPRLLIQCDRVSTTNKWGENYIEKNWNDLML